MERGADRAPRRRVRALLGTRGEPRTPHTHLARAAAAARRRRRRPGDGATVRPAAQHERLDALRLRSRSRSLGSGARRVPTHARRPHGALGRRRDRAAPRRCVLVRAHAGGGRGVCDGGGALVAAGRGGAARGRGGARVDACATPRDPATADLERAAAGDFRDRTPRAGGDRCSAAGARPRVRRCGANGARDLSRRVAPPRSCRRGGAQRMARGRGAAPSRHDRRRPHPVGLRRADAHRGPAQRAARGRRRRGRRDPRRLARHRRALAGGAGRARRAACASRGRSRHGPERVRLSAPDAIAHRLQPPRARNGAPARSDTALRARHARRAHDA